jgi:hypothetical protein
MKTSSDPKSNISPAYPGAQSFAQYVRPIHFRKARIKFMSRFQSGAPASTQSRLSECTFGIWLSQGDSYRFFYIFGKSNEGYAAETNSPPIRQELVHEYARKQIPLAKAAHAATYACHEVTSDCDFSRDLRNTERCQNAERIVKHLGVIVRKELAKIKPPVTMDECHAIAEESLTLAPSPIIKHGAPGEKDTCVTEWKD